MYIRTTPKYVRFHVEKYFLPVAISYYLCTLVFAFDTESPR